MSQAVIDATDVFVSQPADKLSMQALLIIFLEEEALHDGPVVHRPPYSKWRQCLGKTRRQGVVAHLMPLAEAAKFDSELMVLYLAVFMRVNSAVNSVLDSIGSHIQAADLSSLGGDFLFEACNILHAIKSWKTLATVAHFALINADEINTCARRKSLLADWYILASYKLLLPLFQRNTLTETEQLAFAAKVEALALHLPNNGKNMLFYRAIVANLARDLDTAVSCVLDAQKAEGAVIGLFQRLENFVSPADLEAAPELVFKSLLKTAHHHYRHAPTGDPILLVSTNDDYFDRYSDKLIESFAYWNPGAILHIHCAAFQPSETVLDALEAKHGIKINYTIDRQTLLYPGMRNFGGYCAGVRYIFLPEYLATYNRIAVTDMDGLIRRPLTELWQGAPDAILLTSKFMKNEWQSARLLWEMIAAGSFAITATPANRAFAGYLSNYLCDQITICEAQGWKLFSTDQTGLLLAYMRCRETCDFESCDDLYTQSGDWRFGRGDAKAKLQKTKDYRK